MKAALIVHRVVHDVAANLRTILRGVDQASTARAGLARVVKQPDGMSHGFLMPLDRLQPSQLYISAAKLRRVRRELALGGPATLSPLPVVRLGKEVVLTDGHTRASATWLTGRRRVRVAWDMDELDTEAYEICVSWCKEEGIRTIGDLQDRVVDADAYQAQWLDRCDAMHRVLAAQRGAR
jgi:hypothetical protein